jgi:putative acetyltransferase
MDEFTIRPATNGDGEGVRTLVYGILGEFGFTPDPAGTDADLADMEVAYQRPGGTFEVLVDSSGRIVGTVGIFPLLGGRCELRKMYLLPELRGRGLGGRLLRHAVARARELGFTRIELETATVLETAQRMYESFGFRPFTPCQMPSRCDRAYYLDLDEH